MAGQTDTSTRNLAAVLLRAVVLAAPALLAVVLAVRPVASFDVGYHLAYGDRFLSTGRIVQTKRFIYTKLDERVLADPDSLGPGATYDPATGVYRFVNANWLSQVAMAAVHKLGGMNALVVGQAVLVGAIFAVLIVTMRRAGLDLRWAAPAAMAAMLGAYPRFNLRPELFGYVVLVAQWCILIRGDVRARGAAGLIALQILAVNLHSYFYLGIVLAGCMLIDAGLNWLLARRTRRDDLKARAADLRWLALAAAGMVLASLANPWLLRGAVMPAQALHFLLSRDIIGRTPGSHGVLHPWATITELISPFHVGFLSTTAGKVYVATLVLSGIAAAVAAALSVAAFFSPGRRVRVGWLFVLAGMAMISTSMQRNTAPAVMVLVPLSFVVLREGWRALAGRLPGAVRRSARPAAWAAGALTCVAAAVFIHRVVTQRLYFSDRRPWRFGTGISRLALPVDAARWIDRHRPPGRLFCDYDSSSNLLYLTGTEYEVPVLTNTWACPPHVMAEVLKLTGGQRPFRPFATAYDVNTVVIRSSKANGPLIKKLAAGPYWTLVQLHARHAVFVRATEPTAALADQYGIDPKAFDVERHVATVAQSDPVRAFACHNAAHLLYRLAWGDHVMGGGNVSKPDRRQLEREIAWAEHACRVWDEAAHLEPRYREAVLGACNCRALLGTARALLMRWTMLRNDAIESGVWTALDRTNPAEAQKQLVRILLAHDEYQGNFKKINTLRAQAQVHWQQVDDDLVKALRDDPDCEAYRTFLRALRAQVTAFDNKRIEVPPIP